MKSIKIIVVLIGFVYFGLQNSNAQSVQKQEERTFKIEYSKVPESVKETLKNYSGYKISEQVTYRLEKSNNSEKIYSFKIERKNYPYFLLINDKGKVVGVLSKEG